MTTSIVLFEVEGVTLERHPVEQAPRISDAELGRLLGYDRERRLGELLERRLEDFPGVLPRRTLRSGLNTGNTPGFQTTVEHSLSIVDALRLVERSEAPNRAAVLAKLPPAPLVERILEVVSTHNLDSVNGIHRLVMGRRSTILAVVRQLAAEKRLERVNGFFKPGAAS